MHIRRAVVPAAPSDPDTSSPSLALLPLLSLSVLVFILLFFAIRLFKRSLHLPSLTWLRGKGQGAKRSLSLSGVELLPTSLKPIPTPGPSPYAASFTLEGNAGKSKDGSTSLLSRSSSLDGFPTFVVRSLPPPPPTSPPPRRSPFSLPALFNGKRKPLHRRSKSLGGPVRDLAPPASHIVTAGSSAPPTPSPQALLIDFSTSTSSSSAATTTSASSDVGTHRFTPSSPLLIPGLPIPSSSPVRRTAARSHTSFPVFDEEDDTEHGTLLTAFTKRPHNEPLEQLLIQYDRSTSPSPAPKRVNPFASLSSFQRPLSPSPLAPPGIELVPAKPKPVEPVSIAHSPLHNLVDLDTDTDADTGTNAAEAGRHAPGQIGTHETPAVSVPPPVAVHVQERVDCTAADPFDDTHAVSAGEDPSGPSPADAHAYTPSTPVQPLVIVSAPLTLVNMSSEPSSPFSVPVKMPSEVSVSVPVPEVESEHEQGQGQVLSASWSWDADAEDAWSPVPAHLHEYEQGQSTSGWPLPLPSEGAGGIDVDVDVGGGSTSGGVEDPLISLDVAEDVEAGVSGDGGNVHEDGEQGEEEQDPADAWFIEEPTAVWDVEGAGVWAEEGVKAEAEGVGTLFAVSGKGKGLECEEEREERVRILDGHGLLAGPSSSVPVDVYVFGASATDVGREEDREEEEREGEEEEEEEEEERENEDEDADYDINDLHDTADAHKADNATAAIGTTTATSTSTMRSVLSTPTTPNTPLPELPPTPPLPLATLPITTSATSSAGIETKEEVEEEQEGEHPDPDLLPLPTLPLPLSTTPLPPVSLSPQPVSPQPLKPVNQRHTPTHAQTPTPPASPPPPAVPSRPLWSLRAADAPPLGIPAAAAGTGASPSRGVRPEPSEARPVVEVTSETEAAPAHSDAESEEKAGATTVVVDAPPPEKEEEKEEPHSVEELSLSTSLPGSFPSSPARPPAASLPAPEPAHLSLRPRAVASPFSSSSSSSSPPAASSSAVSSSTTTKATRAVPPSSNRLRPPRSALDLALAMQLRPGLGAGADPAWMVRFLMVMFGWVAVLVSGDL